MPESSKTPAAPVQSLETVVLKHHGCQFRVLSPAPLTPGTAVVLTANGESLLCEVALPGPTQREQSERAKPKQDSGPAPAIQDWRVRDSVESVLGSLLALNAQLTFYEERGQAS